MHARNDNAEPVGAHPGSLWFDLAMLLLGLLVAWEAWREITHHDGVILVGVPVATMSIMAALWARGTKR